MAIDGRDLVRRAPDKDAYQSTTTRAIAAAVVIVPLAAIVWVSYWVGTATGGVTGGILGVLSTALTVGVLAAMKRRRR